MAEPTRRRVEAAIADPGFVRNSAARTLAAGRSDTIGVVLTDIGNSMFVDIARGAERAASRAQLKLLLANSDTKRSKQYSYLELFDEARVAGVLLAPLDGSVDAAHAVQAHGTPVALVNAPAPETGLYSVMVNEELGGYLAARHLLNQGAARLGYLAGFPQLRAIRRRLKGIRRAVAEAGASLQVVDVPNLQVGTGREHGRQLLQSEAVDGVVCPSDPLAVGVIQAASELGIRVPDELVVVGYDDNHLATESVIPVSSVSQPGQRMGEVAIELLLDEIKQPSAHAHRAVSLDPYLVPRRSSLRLPADTQRHEDGHRHELISQR